MGRDNFKIVIQSRLFSSDWDRLGMTDSDLRRLESAICDDPEANPVIEGTGGVRKIRFAKKGAGKRGGSRVFYCHIPAFRAICLLVVIAKGEDENISAAEKPAIRRMVHDIEFYLKGHFP